MLWAEVDISVLIICKFSNEWTCTRKKDVEGLSCGFEVDDFHMTVDEQKEGVSKAKKHLQYKSKLATLVKYT